MDVEAHETWPAQLCEGCPYGDEAFICASCLRHGALIGREFSALPLHFPLEIFERKMEEALGVKIRA